MPRTQNQQQQQNWQKFDYKIDGKIHYTYKLFINTFPVVNEYSFHCLDGIKIVVVPDFSPRRLIKGTQAILWNI
jgi:hypothetical protein